MSPVVSPVVGPVVGPSLPFSSSLPTLRATRAHPSVRVLAVFLLLFVALCLGGLGLPWQQSVSGEGRVIAFSPTARQQRLEAPIDGRVVRVRKSEGERGAAGDVVVELADVDPRFVERLENERQLLRLRKDAAELRRAQIDDRITALQNGRAMALAAAAARHDMARERVRQAEQNAAAAAAANDVAQKNLPRVQALAKDGLRSTRDAELAAADAARADAELARAHAALVAAEREAASFDADVRRIEGETQAQVNDAKASRASADAEVAAASAELVRLDVRVARQENQAVTLPRDAVVFRVLAQEGQLVKQGEPLLELVPDVNDRAVEVWVDGNDAPLVSPGRPVRVVFEGWPALQFVGWPQAARGSFGGVVAFVDAHDDGTGRFRVVIRENDDPADAWPDAARLRQGVRAHGFVLLEQVPLGYELWRRLNAFPPTLTQSSSSSSSSSSAEPTKAKK